MRDRWYWDQWHSNEQDWYIFISFIYFVLNSFKYRANASSTILPRNLPIDKCSTDFESIRSFNAYIRARILRVDIYLYENDLWTTLRSQVSHDILVNFLWKELS